MNHRIQIYIIAILLIAVCSTCSIAASDEIENIQNVNCEIGKHGANWIAGPTSVSGWTAAERQHFALSDPIPEPDGTIVCASSMRTLRHEKQFDWRDEGMVTSVKSQGSCGSCWAFGAIGAVESAVLIYTEKNLDLSEQHLVSSCCAAGSCSGGWPDWALKYIRDTGVPDEACYPYKASNDGCNPCTGWQDRAWKIKDYVYVEPSTDDFKWALKEYGPLSVVLTAPDDWYTYRSGVYSPVMDVGWANHAVILVGWDDSDGCWIIKNSWGAGWGMDGFAYVKYGNLERYNYAHAITGIIDHGASPDVGTWIKPVSAIASSDYSESYAADKSIDNQTNTYWFSERHEEDSSIAFDLGELLTIGKVQVMIFHRDVPVTMNIDVSSDGAHWRTVAEDFVIEIGSEYVEVPFALSQCQYVRMTQTETARIYGTCTEISVWVIEDEEPDYTTTLEIAYANRTETIELDEDITNMTLFQNGLSIWKWWASSDGDK